MISCPKPIKISLVFFFLILAFFIAWFFYFNSSERRDSKEILKHYQEIDNKIGVSSNISNIDIDKGNSETFFEYLDEWDVFDGQGLFLNSIENRVFPEKIFFNLTDQPQLYNWWMFNRGNNDDFKDDIIIASVGESWDEDSKRLDFYIYINPLMLEGDSDKNRNELLNSFILYILYERSHKDQRITIYKGDNMEKEGSADYNPKTAKMSTINLLNQKDLPFNLNKNE
jgi:hypothetical protein